MEVKGKVLYHLHRKNRHSTRWKVGKTVETNAEDNYFRKLRYADFYRISAEIRQGEPYMTNVLTELNGGRSFLQKAMFMPDQALLRSGVTKVEELLKLSENLHDCLVVYIRFLTHIV